MRTSDCQLGGGELRLDFVRHNDREITVHNGRFCHSHIDVYVVPLQNAPQIIQITQLPRTSSPAAVGQIQHSSVTATRDWAASFTRRSRAVRSASAWTSVCARRASSAGECHLPYLSSCVLYFLFLFRCLTNPNCDPFRSFASFAQQIAGLRSIAIVFVLVASVGTIKRMACALYTMLIMITTRI